jgi:dihydrofolate reductase
VKRIIACKLITRTPIHVDCNELGTMCRALYVLIRVGLIQVTKSSYNDVMNSINNSRIAVIAAVATNGIIGKNGTLPWHLPADLKYFKALTTGKRIIMGRRTWQSFPKPLPNRQHVVVSSTALELPQGVIQCASLVAALSIPNPTDTVFVIGGNQLYADAIPRTDDLYLTEIEANVDGDTVFPEWPHQAFREVSRDTQHAPLHAGGNDVTFHWVHYVRK